MKRLEQVVRSAARQLAFAERDPRLLVGISGGPDSLALLHVLHLWAPGAGVTLQAIHVDHGLRPESADDAARVQALCDALGVPVSVVRVDARAIAAARGRGIEDGARTARYQAFVEGAAAIGAGVVALAHHRDDQAETVLLHLLRGAGTGGLGGMRVQRDIAVTTALGLEAPPLTIWRPFLGESHAALVAYCAAVGLDPLQDPSNAELTYRRNVVRHHLLPMLSELFPGAPTTLARAAGLLADDDAYLEAVVSEQWDAVASLEGALVVLRRGPFRGLPPALQRRVVRRAWQQATAPGDALDYRATEAVRAAIAGPRSGQRFSLPHGMCCVVDRDEALLLPDRQRDELLCQRFDLPLLPVGWSRVVQPPTTFALEGGWIVACRERAPGRPAGERPPTLHIPASMTGQLVLRSWQAGDWLVLGTGQQQKLQDWFVNQGVPAYLRGRLPMLCASQRVHWIAGIAAFPGTDLRPANAVTDRVDWGDGGDRVDYWTVSLRRHGQPRSGARRWRPVEQGVGYNDP